MTWPTLLLAAVGTALGVAGLPGAPEAGRPGVPPQTPWACPDSHPLKGYVLADSGRRVYYHPANRFYEETSPERCYATEEEARRDGGRAAPVGIPAGGRDVVRSSSSPLTIAESGVPADTRCVVDAPRPTFRG
jgi:hypothetical protein